MKKALLFILFIGLFSFAAHAQLSDCGNCNDQDGNYNNKPPTTYTSYQSTAKKKITVYPNPATNFIGLSDTENVEEIHIYNIIGRKVATFQVEKDGKYDVANLVKGMYLVRIIDANKKIVTTQRLNKR